MTIFEYFLGEDIKHLRFDEEQRKVFIKSEYFHNYEREGIFGNELTFFMRGGEVCEPEEYYLEIEQYEHLCKYNILVSDGVSFDVSARTPYYRLRGKPITEEQALEIIRFSEHFFSPYNWDNKENTGFLYPQNFMIDLIPNRNDDGLLFHSWVHIDGSVGTGDCTDKYPDIGIFISEWIDKLELFPFLDVIIVITTWDSTPRNRLCYLKEKYINLETAEYDEEFFDVIEMGIHVHDKTIEFLTKEETIPLYKQYDSLYDEEKKKYFYQDFYRYKKPLSKEYVRKCAEAFGYDGDEAVRRVEKYERDDNRDLSGLLCKELLDNLHIVPKCSLV